ncbi:hypothetical protein ACLMAJ_16755 [Nocardia sp. KC 131]|uniref:hypothetical protein n=1 Tax=Nocardia arseniciresistens TaxID=3392119 RepID=UPI00398F193B
MGLWGDIASSVASMAGYAIGGPAGAALLGGVVGGIAAGFESGWDPTKMLEGAAYGAVGGLLGGGMGGLGVKTMVKSAGRTAIRASYSGGRRALISSGRRALPEAWKASQTPLRLVGKKWSSAKGLAGAAGGHWTVDSAVHLPQTIRERIDLYFGDHKTEFPEIPLIDISPADTPAGLRHVMMPDPKALPDGLTLSAVPEANYRGLPQIYLGSWQSFGDGPYTPIPEKRPVPEIKGAEAANIPNYLTRVDVLAARYHTLREADIRVSQVVGKGAEGCEEGRTGIDSLIKSTNGMAGTHPFNIDAITKYAQDEILDATNLVKEADFTEDNYLIAVVESSIMNLDVTMNGDGTEDNPGWANLFEALAADINKEQPGDAEKPGDVAKPGAVNVDDGKDSTAVPDLTNSSVPVQTSTSQASAAGVGSPPPAWEWGTGQTSKTGSSTGGADSSSKVAASTPAKTESASSDTSPVAQADPASAAATSASPAAGTASIAPALLAMANLANAGRRAGTDDSGDSDDENRSRDDREKTGGAPGGTPAAAASAQPATSTQPAAAPTAQQAASPGRVGATPISAMAASVRAPSEDGSLIYTFPDGRTQRVSAVVAHALDAAFGNAAATDARDAYAKTAAAVPAGQGLGSSVDPYQLMTGDVAWWRLPIPGEVESWSETSALVVVFGADVNSTFEMIIDGELKPFAAQASGKQGDFGPFAGFLHPAGIEIAVAAPDAAIQSATVPADPAAGASMVVPA